LDPDAVWDGELGRSRMHVLDGGGDRRREWAVWGELGASHCNQRGLCCIVVRERRTLPKLIWDDLFHIVQELRAIYLLEMTKCLTGIFRKGLPWDIQNRTS